MSDLPLPPSSAAGWRTPQRHARPTPSALSTEPPSSAESSDTFDSPPPHSDPPRPPSYAPRIDAARSRTLHRELRRSLIALPFFLAIALPVGIALVFTPLPWIEGILPDMYALFAFLIFGTLWAVARGGVEVWLLTREDRAAGRSWRSWQTDRPEPLFVRKRPDEATIRKIRSMRDGPS